MNEIIQARQLKKIYSAEGSSVVSAGSSVSGSLSGSLGSSLSSTIGTQVLDNVNLDIKAGEAICIVGPSGSGKSTLLHLLGTLDRPTQGEVFIYGKSVFQMGDEELAEFRNKEMGFVFQFHHLMNEFTVLENVMLPAQIGHVRNASAKMQALQLLDQLGLKHRLHHYPNQLSGGELQRAAIARALVRRPKILFADEPTGNLDSHNAALVQDLFFQLKESFQLTLIVVTHDLNFAKKFGKVLRMSDGRIQ